MEVDLYLTQNSIRKNMEDKKNPSSALCDHI